MELVIKQLDPLFDESILDKETLDSMTSKMVEDGKEAENNVNRLEIETGQLCSKTSLNIQ